MTVVRLMQGNCCPCYSSADYRALHLLQVIAQANTFTLAGYETTANTLAFCIYNIASHPEAQQHLLDEIDAYGRDRKVAYSDMGKVSSRQLA